MTETRNPLWDNVLLVTFTHPGILNEIAKKRVEESLSRILRPLTDAKILILEEGATLHLDEKGMQIWEEPKVRRGQ